ncbi:MAG TPA: TIGR03936 family radical SAM-associated protein, partial [Spirochaetales bacterium]|nr:TIGR03936 family radical SAM-associated protein [Spirochaetales bacterium]
HAPYLSWLEGLVSRGDERVGQLILKAWQNGARFDAWDDKFKKEAWETALASMPDFDPASVVGHKPIDAQLPWDSVNLRVSKRFLAAELDRSIQSVMSPICIDTCVSPCGSCTDTTQIVDKSIHLDMVLAAIKARGLENAVYVAHKPGTDSGRLTTNRQRVLVCYEKHGSAAFYPQHTLWGIIASAFERSGISMEYSQGFNPQPRLEISEPMSLGTMSDDEYAVALLAPGETIDITAAQQKLQAFLPRGLHIKQLWLLPSYEGRKFPSLSALYAGSLYRMDFSDSGLDAARFVSLVQRVAQETESMRAAGVNPMSTTSSCIDVYLPFGGKRELSISGLFQSAYDQPLRDATVMVTRLSQRAKRPDGALGSYQEAYGL